MRRRRARVAEPSPRAAEPSLFAADAESARDAVIPDGTGDAVIPAGTHASATPDSALARATPRASVHAGIDEAGLGPVLGPLAIGACAFRLPPGVAPSQIEVMCRSAAPVGASLSCAGGEVAHVASRDNAVVRALTASIRESGGSPQPRVKSGTSDMNVVGPVWKCPIAAYGPGDSHLDHTPEERISLAEFARSIDVLMRALHHLAVDLIGRGEIQD